MICFELWTVQDRHQLGFAEANLIALRRDQPFRGPLELALFMFSRAIYLVDRPVLSLAFAAAILCRVARARAAFVP